MSSNVQQRRHVFGRPKPTGPIGRTDTGKLVIGGGGVILGLFLGSLLPGQAKFIVSVLVIGGSLAFVTIKVRVRGSKSKRTLYDWFPALVEDHKKQKQAQGRVIRNPRRRKGYKVGEIPKEEPPPGVSPFRWLSGESTSTGRPRPLAVQHHTVRRCMTAPLQVEGPGLVQFDSDDRAALADRWAYVLNHVGNNTGHARRVQVIFRGLKPDPDGHAHWVERQRDDDAPEFLKGSYDDLAATIATSTQDYRTYVVLHMEETLDVTAEKRDLGGGDDALALLMSREVDDLASVLPSADIHVVEPLDGPRLAAVIANAYDPDQPIDGRVARVGAFPETIDVSSPSCFQSWYPRGDHTGWFHATAWVMLPSTPVPVGFLTPALTHVKDVIRTISITYDLEPNHLARRRAMRDGKDDAADRIRDENRGRFADPMEQARHGGTLDRGDELVAGHAGAAVNIWLTVSARSEDELRLAKKTMEAKFGSSFCTLQWCDLEHARAFANTLPIASGAR